MIILVDANNAAHRYRHVYTDLKTAKGVRTGVLFGFLRMINHLQDAFAPDKIVMFWDSNVADGELWRTKLYPEYKQQRKAKRRAADPDEKAAMKEFYNVELPRTKAFLHKMGIPQIAVPHLEADDLIAMATRTLTIRKTTGNLYVVPVEAKSKDEMLIISSDSDFYQLVNRRIRVYNEAMDAITYYDESSKMIKTQKQRDSMSLAHTRNGGLQLFSKCIVGDTSDSIPGASGVGIKSVEILLKHTSELFHKGFIDRWSSRQIVDYLTKHLISPEFSYDFTDGGICLRPEWKKGCPQRVAQQRMEKLREFFSATVDNFLAKGITEFGRSFILTNLLMFAYPETILESFNKAVLRGLDSHGNTTKHTLLSYTNSSLRKAVNSLYAYTDPVDEKGINRFGSFVKKQWKNDAMFHPMVIALQKYELNSLINYSYMRKLAALGHANAFGGI